MIAYVNYHEPEDAWRGYAYTFLMFFAAVLQSLCIHYYFHLCFRVGMRIRTAIIATVYAKVHNIIAGPDGVSLYQAYWGHCYSIVHYTVVDSWWYITIDYTLSCCIPLQSMYQRAQCSSTLYVGMPRKQNGRPYNAM